MFLVGRRPAEKPFNIRHYLKHYPYTKNLVNDSMLLQWGEPFFIDGRNKGRPVIAVLGPGSFWMKSIGDLKIIGEASDSDDVDEMEDVLHSRRRGDVFGRWYSEYCPEGEIGFVHFNVLKEISVEEFEREKSAFNRRRL